MGRSDRNNIKKNGAEAGRSRYYTVKWPLVIYDIITLVAVAALISCSYYFWNMRFYKPNVLIIQSALALVSIIGARFLANTYSQIWRYGGIQPYLRLFISDFIGGVVCTVVSILLPNDGKMPIAGMVLLCCMNLLLVLAVRMIYRYAYKCSRTTFMGRMLAFLLKALLGRQIDTEHIEAEKKKIKIAIVGAGQVGVALAEELLSNSAAAYVPRCFIDVNSEKIGREIHGMPVLSEENATFQVLNEYEIQEIVFALPDMTADEKKELYEYYKRSGYKIKIYDYPTMTPAGNSKRALREFNIEELLFRKPVTLSSDITEKYYRGKRIMITGGGGSIGSELCRQIAAMKPEVLVIVDVYENGAYDVQQELRIAYGGALNLKVEILSVCNRAALDRIFSIYRPQVILHAAAHKHVPLMEHNCCEAVENNVFGTLNVVELAEEHGVEHFIMVSTDKAVNPTNVMGATKRMCEMIIQSHSASQDTTVYSATRFGNVLGSAGSVIPLFKRQISSGGPITLTDKRIIRYFMTIPEASRLVLQSGAMAKNGELFVLDMGKPVKIVELAENMIRLSGLEPYRDIDIVEIGLRPGEKLYEELLIKSEELDKTDDEKIFIEKDEPLSRDELERRLEMLRRAVENGDDELVKQTLRKCVPTFKTPEEINAEAAKAKEMNEVKG